MNEEINDDKKATVKNTVVVNGSSTIVGQKKTTEKRLLPITPSTSNNKTDIHVCTPFAKQVISLSTNSKPDVHISTPFANQVVHDVRIPQTLVKTKSSSCASNNKVGSVTSSFATGDNKKLIDKALKARLYFLQQTGPHQFLIGGDSPDHKYRITIGSQKCSCGKDNLCVHIYFVMLRVFQVPINDPILSKRTLKNFEVEALLRNFSARRRSKIKSLVRSTSIKKDHPKPFDGMDGSSVNSSSSSSPPIPSATKDSVENIVNENTDEETCPICLLELVEGESLTECKECQNKYHQHCIDIWTLECSQQKEPVICPLCRAAWRGAKSCGSGGIEAHGTASSGVTILDDLAPDLRAVVSEWLKTFSNDLVQKLASKNWTDREIGLRNFPDEVLMSGYETADHESCSLATFESAIHVLSHLVLDPVYKVFVAALRAFRNILLHTPCQNESQQSHLRFILQPFIQSLFVKCSDGNKKTGLLAISTLEEFVKGQEGELSIGKDVSNVSTSLPLGDPNYLLTLILRNNDPCLLDVEEWQLVYGKLIILNRLIQIFSNMFLFSDQNQNSTTDLNCCAGVDISYRPHFLFDNDSKRGGNKNLFLDFCLRYLSHPHVRISLTSRNILLCITRLNARKNEGLYQRILSHVSNSTLVDSSLKETLLTKLLRIEEEIKTPDGRNESPGEGRRKSIPGSQPERTVRNRPGSSRTNWFTRSGSFKMASERSRRVKSSTASPVPDPWYRRSPIDRRKVLRKNLSISDDSVFKSTDSSLTAEMTLSCKGAPLRGRHSEYERDVGMSYSLHRCFSEFSVMSKKQISSKRKDVIVKIMSKVKCKDAATSTSPPLATTNTSGEGSSTKTPRPSKPPLWKDSKHNRQCSGGSERDFDDVVSSTPSSEKVSFKTEVAMTPNSSPQTTMEESCPCKEEVDKEEAEALARALDISDTRQEALPFVPGLSASNPKMMSQSLSEELKETKISWTSFSSNGSPGNDGASATGKMSAYEENIHWKRGPMLGSGAACTCYQARDIKTGVLMAVKLISFCRNTVEEQDKVKQMIVDEVHILAQLDHPNIVRILGATLQSTHVFMFFEWMPGRSVSSLLGLYGPFSESVVTKYTLQILGGLIYLHDNQILHRDLKGANILVDSTGQRLRIGDFGTSARLSSSRTMQGEFQGQLLGTVAFMAPEVLKGSDYGRSCDIWSLGCCMIEMLTGSPPWIAKHLSNHLALMFKIASSDKPPPIPEYLNPAIKDFLLRCLDVSPSERPAAKDLLKHPLFRT